MKKIAKDINIICRGFTTVNTQLQNMKEDEPHLASLFNQTSGRNVGMKTKIYLREVILMYIQLTMDLFCNRALVDKIAKSKTKVGMGINIGTMIVSHQATVNGYHNIVW